VASEDQLRAFGDVKLLAGDVAPVDLERLAADRLDLDVAFVELGDQGVLGIDREIGKMDAATAVAADLHLVAVDPAGADDLVAAGLQRDLANKKAHPPLTSRKTR
jgi:sugar/nucleoside kinase (ribokinase family)